ncbi:MAG TPA: arylesterase [Vicinamibacterales bacterium]|nr:arylesterase [Vicinamibacterales bacterium]
MTSFRVGLSLVALALSSACTVAGVGCSLPSAPPEGEAAADAVPAEGGGAPVSTTGVVGIAFLGDSLTAGFGLLSEQAYPALVERLFHDEGYDEVTAINAGVSGDTTAGGLRRIDDLLEPQVRIVVVALGGNDALRGLTTLQTRENLAAIIDRALDSGREVLVAGMLAPTNLGPDYQASFRDIFQRLAVAYGDRIEVVPFLLEGVAGNPALNQGDGIHPTAEGSRVIAELLYPRLRVLVDLVSSGGGGE